MNISPNDMDQSSYEEQPRMPAVSRSVLNALIAGVLGNDKTNTLALHRLVRALIYFGARIGRHLEYTHGIAGLADCIQMRGGTARKSVREALDVLSRTQLTFKVGETVRTASVVEVKYAGREIHLDIGDALLPNYFLTFEKSTRSGREARMLVPCGLPVPPFHGWRMTWPAQATLQLIFLRTLREDALRIAQTGWALIPPERWRTLCDEARVPFAMVAGIQQAWRDGALLSPVDGQGYWWALADEEASKFLREAGMKELNGHRAHMVAVARAERRAARLNGG